MYAVFRIMFTSDARPQESVEAVRAVFADSGLPVILSGEPYLQSEIFSYVYQIVTRLPPIALFLILLVFRLRIGSLLATILSLVPAVVGAILTLGTIGWIIGGISIMSALVPIFVIVIGSADGLHVTSHVMDRLEAGDDSITAMTSTLKAVGLPVVLTTLTTMAGFFSLTLINSDAIAELGIVAAFGVLVAGIATWIILPAILLMVHPRRRHRPQRGALTVRVLSSVRGIPALAATLVLILAAVPGALRVESNFSMIDIYKPATEIRQNIEAASAILGGSIPVYVTFDQGDALSPEAAAPVLELQDQLMDAGVVGRSVSVYSLIRDLWSRAGQAGDFPPDAGAAENLLAQLPFDAEEMRTGFTADDGRGRAVFFLRDLDSSTLQTLEDVVEQVSSRYDRQLQPVGTAFVMKEMNDQIIHQQLGALLLAIVVTFLLITLTQRSLSAGLLSTLPILITLIVMFGVMGYAGIALSVITAIMSGLTIGVGIDYSIHYVSLLRYERKRNSSQPSVTALHYVATPVLANAAGLAIGFTAMAFSPMQIHVTLSVLMWVTMMTSALLSLTLLPTIASWSERGRQATNAAANDTPDA
ncbi:MAG: hypothetical protein EA383_02700 [Spirochaetaceae bacterium]|nr:MAG: hypothetical protein EA383_02700 [Spirochaetaceae bacterium]